MHVTTAAATAHLIAVPILAAPIAVEIAPPRILGEPSIVRYAPRAHDPGAPRAEFERSFDEAVLVATLQGLVNRSEPRLWVDALPPDAYWWEQLDALGVFAGREVWSTSRLETLLAIHAGEFRGLVAWDPDVPATLNAATVAAGVEDLLVVRSDPTPGTLFHRLTIDPDGPGLPVALDLDGLFTGSGTVPGTSRPSSGSTKGDAYLWAIEHYVRTGAVTSTAIGYALDGYFLERPAGAPADLGNGQVWNRDDLVARRAFVFDLGFWADELPVDDPTQPLGTDHAVLLELLRAIWDLHGGAGFTTVQGFTPWAYKYTDFGAAGGSRDPVSTEWETARVVSSYDMLLDADALSLSGMANGTVHRLAPPPPRSVAPPAPSRADLRDRGFWDNRLANPGFERDLGASSWNLSVSDVQVAADYDVAAFGQHYLRARAAVDVPPNSIAQDVVLPAPAGVGDVVRASVWLRNPEPVSFSGSLVIWGLDGGAPTPSVLPVELPGDAVWRRFEVAWTAPRSGDVTLRFELYLPLGGPLVEVDGAALWKEGSEAGVQPRNYVLQYAGDYDSAAWIYQNLERVWDDPERGAVPTAYGFCTNLSERIPAAFHAIVDGMKPDDRLIGCDTVAGYVHPTQLLEPRSPSGLPSGRDSWIRTVHPFVQHFGVRSTGFVLNPSAPLDDAAWDAIRYLTGDGVVANGAGQAIGPPFLQGRTPITYQDSDILSDFFGTSPSEAAATLHATTADPTPTAEFSVYRSILATPSWLRQVAEAARTERPSRSYEVVDPAVFFRLLELELGGTPHYRATFVDVSVPEELVAGTTAEVRVTVRNDGWLAWPADGSWRVGLHLAAEPIDPDTLPLGSSYPWRQALSAAVEPGAQSTVVIPFTVPAAGSWYAQVDVVEELVTWLETQRNLPWKELWTVD